MTKFQKFLESKGYKTEGMFDFFKSKPTSQFANNPEWADIYTNLLKYYNNDSQAADNAIQSSIKNFGEQAAKFKLMKLGSVAGPQSPQEDLGDRSQYRFDQYKGGGKFN